MTDDKPKETQQELFQEFSPAPKKAERFPALAQTQKPILFSTTLEQLLMVSIVAILALCGVFFLGVLRGKALKAPALAPAAPPAVTRVMPVAVATPRVSVPSPAPAAVSAAPNMKTTADKPYTIQLVTYRKQELADAEVAAARKLGYVGFIITSGEYFQVCAGQYATKDAAQRDLALFKTRYKDSFLRHR